MSNPLNLKVGDRVRVKSLEWYDANKGRDGYVRLNPVFSSNMAKCCGQEVTIMTAAEGSNGILYRIAEDEGCWWWSCDMFEDESATIKAITEIDTVLDSEVSGTEE